MHIRIERRLDQPRWLSVAVPVGSLLVRLRDRRDRPARDRPRPARDLPPALRGGVHPARRARPDARSRRRRSRSPGSRRPPRSGCASSTSAPRGSSTSARSRASAAGLYFGGRGGASVFVIAAMVVCGLPRRRALGADPGRAAGVLQDERDHHLADAQLRRRVPAHVPDLPDRVVLAPDDGLQRLRLPDRARRCPTSAVWPAWTINLQGGIAVPLGLRDRLRDRRAASGSSTTRTRFGFEVQVLGDSERAARYGGVRVRRKILAVMAISGGDRRPRRREPGRRLQPLARRRPERAPEARLRLHGDRRRRARPLQPVRASARRVPDRRARERRQHAPGPGLPGRPRRRAPGDHPLLRARRRAARPLPRPDLPAGRGDARRRRRVSLLFAGGVNHRLLVVVDRLGDRLRDAAPLRRAGRAARGALRRAQPRGRGDDARRRGDGLLDASSASIPTPAIALAGRDRPSPRSPGPRWRRSTRSS